MTNSWRPPAVALGRVRAKHERLGGTAKRRERSAAGGAAGSHSALIVPWKPGNLHRLGPGGGKRGVGQLDRRKATQGGIELLVRVTVTLTDSANRVYHGAS